VRRAEGGWRAGGGVVAAGAESLMDTRASGQMAEERAALRRVAALVAGGTRPEEIFEAVTAEVGRLLGADLTAMARYDQDTAITYVARWSAAGDDLGDSLPSPLGGQNVITVVFETGRPARADDIRQASGPAGEWARRLGVNAAVGGRLWGVMTIASTSQKLLPPGTEERLAAFTELVGTAIANAQAQAALAASRARIVTTADETRRRIERDLHDGAQQSLVTLALQLRELQVTAPAEARELTRGLDRARAGLDAALAELREIAHGIHPAVLTTGGLEPALKALARRCPVPVASHVQADGRPAGPVEIAAYYVVAEALTNIAKHALASAASIDVTATEGVLRVRVRDDGSGGADLSRGSGLVGLKDRVEALGGQVSLHSPPGEGTTLSVNLPLAGPDARGQR
jgi:signal transduction histidine kinase